MGVNGGQSMMGRIQGKPSEVSENVFNGHWKTHNDHIPCEHLDIFTLRLK